MDGASYSDRFDAAAFADDEPVEIRAHRGSRRASIYDEHVMPEDLFARMVSLASADKLHQLSSLDPYGPTELTPSRPGGLQKRLLHRPSRERPAAEPHLTAIRRVADSCLTHSGDSWLLIEGP
jgi:hypothetical protein